MGYRQPARGQFISAGTDGTLLVGAVGFEVTTAVDVT